MSDGTALVGRDSAIGRLDGAGGGPQSARVSRSGGPPRHVAVHPSSLLLVVSGYDGVSVVPVRGRPVASVRGLAQVMTPQLPGGAPGPVTDRQAGPHPHSATLLDERHVVVDGDGTPPALVDLLHPELAGLGDGDDDEEPPRGVAHSAAHVGSPAVAVAL